MENNNYVKLKSNGFVGKIISETKTTYKIKLLDTSTIIQINKKLVDIVDDKKTIYKLNDKTKPKISLRYTIDTDKNFEPEIMLRHQNEIEAIENLDNFNEERKICNSGCATGTRPVSSTVFRFQGAYIKKKETP